MKIVLIIMTLHTNGMVSPMHVETSSNPPIYFQSKEACNNALIRLASVVENHLNAICAPLDGDEK